MSTTPISASYGTAIASIQTALQDNQLSQGEQQDIEKQLQALGIETAFLYGNPAGINAELRRTLDLLIRLDNGQTVQALANNVTSIDLSTSVMTVQLERANLIEEDLRLQLESVQQRSRDIEALTGMRSEVRALRPDDGSSVTLPPDLIARLTAQGIIPGDPLSAQEIDALSESIGARIDSLSSTQQLEQIRTQNLANKRNEAFETVSNLLSQFNKTKEGIIANLR
jgi:hypothetical protein